MTTKLTSKKAEEGKDEDETTVSSANIEAIAEEFKMKAHTILGLSRADDIDSLVSD